MISIDNMHVITHCKIDVPKKYSRDKLKAEGVVRSFIMLPQKYLITYQFTDICAAPPDFSSSHIQAILNEL